MPFYEYQCRHCGHQTEVLQKVSDAPLRKCPACGRNGLTKLISAPIFRLKGGGWYETDFKGEQDRKRNLAGDEPADKPAAEKAPEKAPEKASEKPAGKPKPNAKSTARAKMAAKPVRKPVRKPATKPSAKRR